MAAYRFTKSNLKETLEIIYAFIVSYVKREGYPPSVREICQGVGIKSTSTVHAHLRRLQDEGKIEYIPGKRRAIMIKDIARESETTLPKEIPLVGTVTAGVPILAEENILPTGEFVEVGKSELVGPAVGTTPIIVKEKFKKAKGGVLFIDEAYSLYGDPYGDDAIDTIVQEMENNREDTVVIFAGYPAPMEKFLERNPGMKSRIAFNISFDDYSTEELMQITKLMLSGEQMTASPAALEKLKGIYERAAGGKDFGNGRFVRKLLEHAELNLSSRVMELDAEQLTPEVLGRIEECDIIDITPEKKETPRQIGFICA